MNSKIAMLAISAAVILGSVIVLTQNEGQEINLSVTDGLGLFLFPAHQDKISFGGVFELTVLDSVGNVKDYKKVDNLVVDIGLQTVADQMFPNIDLNSSTQAQFSYLRIGTSNTAPAGGQTDIITPIGGCAAVQDTLVEGSFATNTATIVVDGSFSGATCAGTIEEAVLANASTGGQILSRTLTGTTVVGAGDTLNVTYTFTIKDDGV